MPPAPALEAGMVDRLGGEPLQDRTFQLDGMGAVADADGGFESVIGERAGCD